ncbi:unnamed protein product [Nippostrongylus brasiliensis]|uniref:Uncharacterized protein n=1 Tax=Nippostrongylus brasiliensis TaxID=27835 RepID=A0A0N4YWH6_NIPBR|nr:unnamed protein product [Nippostrongylus brasiliensis]
MRRGSMQTECYGGEKVNARQGKDARRKPRLCGNLENTGGKGVDVIAPTATVRFLQSAPMAQPKFKKSAQKIHYEPAKDFPGKVFGGAKAFLPPPSPRRPLARSPICPSSSKVTTGNHAEG